MSLASIDVGAFDCGVLANVLADTKTQHKKMTAHSQLLLFTMMSVILRLGWS